MLDVVGLYTNILHEDGLGSLQEGLDSRKNPEVPTNDLLKLMEIILKNNLFIFHDELWKQEIADIFMARRIDSKIISLARKYGINNKSPLKMLKRFLDDIFSIFQGTSKQLHKLFEEMNHVHKSIKFPMNHTSSVNEAEEDRCQCKR